MRWKAALSLLVAAAAFIAYWNSLDCGYVRWDDTGYYTNNPLVTGDGGMSAIWLDAFQKKPVKHYYPLVWTTYWIEYRLFGDSPRALHAAQLGLHAATSIAVLLALLALGVRPFAATAAAMVFAVHPINVASVTWLAERKNTLSAVFFWLALLAYIRFRQTRTRWRYGASIVAYLLALLAKTACVVLAPLLLVTDRILDGRWTLRSLARAAPFFVIGLIMGLLTARAEDIHAKSGNPIDPALRPLVAAAALVHYTHKSVVPLELVPIYPRWPESFAAPRYWISVATVVAAAMLLWRFRRAVPPLAAWSISLFVLGLLPVLGFMHFNFLQYAFVSDHFMYLSSVGIFLLLGLLLHRLADGPSREKSPGASTPEAPPTGTRPSTRKAAATATLILLCAGLAVLTIRQNRVWAGPVTFWEYTLTHNPDCFPGYFNLANLYFRESQFEKALAHYEQAARVDPSFVVTHRGSARSARNLNRADEAVAHYHRAAEAERRKNPRSVSTRAEYADYLRQLGRTGDAIREYEIILSMNPAHAGAQKALSALTQPANAAPSSQK